MRRTSIPVPTPVKQVRRRWWMSSARRMLWLLRSQYGGTHSRGSPSVLLKSCLEASPRLYRLRNVPTERTPPGRHGARSTLGSLCPSSVDARPTQRSLRSTSSATPISTRRFMTLSRSGVRRGRNGGRRTRMTCPSTACRSPWIAHQHHWSISSRQSSLATDQRLRSRLRLSPGSVSINQGRSNGLILFSLSILNCIIRRAVFACIACLLNGLERSKRFILSSGGL